MEFDQDLVPDLGLCLHCKATFPYRSNRKFCSGNCRKSHSRGLRNRTSSATKRREEEEKFDRAQRLGDMLFDMHSRDRLGFVCQLVEEARQGNMLLREVLTCPKLLKKKARPEYRPRWDPRLPTITQAADAFCRRFWNAPVFDVVLNRVPEPPTGEVTDGSACPGFRSAG